MLDSVNKLLRGLWLSNPPRRIRHQCGRKSAEFHPLTIGCCTGSVVVTEGVGKNWNRKASTVAQLRVINVTFYTSDDDKRAESHIEMKLHDASGHTVAAASGSYGKFNNGTVNGPFGLRVVIPVEKNRLQSGGVFVLSWTALHNTDQWHLSGMSVDIAFDDSTHLFLTRDGFQLTAAHPQIEIPVPGK